MTETRQTTNSGTTESVYQTHRDRISADRVYKPNNTLVEQIKTYAGTKIVEDDAGRVNCASFKSLNHVCKFIAANEDVPVTKVYPSLRMIGYNIRYNDMKNNNPDMLYEMGGLVKRCVLTSNPNAIDFATNDDNLFGRTLKSVYRIREDVIAVAMKDAESAGIQVSELNMFNVLEGVDALTSMDADYALMRDNMIFRKTLLAFDEIKQSIRWKIGWMEAGIQVRV